MATRLQIAKPDIIRAFSQGPLVLRPSDLADIFRNNRLFWRLAQRTTLRDFTAFMLEKTALQRVNIQFPRQVVSGYTWGKVPLLEALLGLVPDSYYSHYTAVRIHGLTEQVPKTLYLSREKSRWVGDLQLAPYPQKAIDEAFSKPPRISGNQAEITEEGVRVVLL